MATAATVPTRTPATEQARRPGGTRSPAPLRPPAPLKASQLPIIRPAASLRDSLSSDNGSALLGFVGHQNPIHSLMFHRVKGPLVLLFVKATHRFACQRNARPPACLSHRSAYTSFPVYLRY